MEFLQAILVCLFFVVLSSIGIIYSGMDKQITRAIMHAKQMEKYLDMWVRIVAEQADKIEKHHEIKKRIFELIDRYLSNRKKKEILQKISLVNMIAYELSASDNRDSFTLNISMADNSEYLFKHLDVLRIEYNRCATKLNSRLKVRLSATVGKLFRIRELEALSDLSLYDN